MKKVFLAALAVSILSTSAMAAWFEGKIGKVNAINTGQYVVEVIPTDGSTAPYYSITNSNPDGYKQMIATVLTAKASGATVRMYDVNKQWTRMILQ